MGIITSLPIRYLRRKHLISLPPPLLPPGAIPSPSTTSSSSAILSSPTSPFPLDIPYPPAMTSSLTTLSSPTIPSSPVTPFPPAISTPLTEPQRDITFLPFPSITTPVTELNEFHSKLSEDYSILFTTQTILSELCEKEPIRFSFINEALHEYIFGQSKIIDKYNRACKLFENICSKQPEGVSEEFIKLHHKVQFINECQKWEKEDGTSENNSDSLATNRGLDDILNSLIYEIMNVFNIDFAPGEGFTKFIPGLSKTLYVLSSLCEKIMSAEVQQPTENENSKHGILKEPPSRHLNMEPLDCTTGQIRILRVLCGTGDDIRCSLEERNLYRDGIEVALSYVWGKGLTKKRISVNDVPFDVTENLYEILHNLRNTNSCQDLCIWVDAICIDQANDTEKMHQVRLMRDIYTEARKTIVWLGDTSDQISESDTERKPDEVDPLVIAKFEEEGIRQYDLCTILSTLKECPLQGECIEKKLALYIMLYRCIQDIFSQEWWERIWTIQEAALPRSSPIFYFKGTQFSFADLTAAMNMVFELSETLGKTIEELKDTTGYKPGVSLSSLISQARRMRPLSVPILIYLRQGFSRKKDENFNTFVNLLECTGTYKATNPRDKIFALESLLPRHLGRLIHVNYTEPWEDTYKRATARYYNTTPGASISSYIKFWGERQSKTNEGTETPSWVLDFTHSDSSRFESDAKIVAHKVTLDGFIATSARSNAKMKRFIGRGFLATPKTLFCRGISIDKIWKVELVTNNDYDDITMAAMFNASDALKDQKDKRFLHQIAEEDWNTKFMSNCRFFTMLENFELPIGDFKDLLKKRQTELATRKHSYFVTEKGILGMATADINVGDELCVIKGMPIYPILREVKDELVQTKMVKKHRIVARAAVNDTFEDLDMIVDSSEETDLQII